jgi:hypothetical protein
MMNRMKSRFLVTTAALLAGVSIVSAQSLQSGPASEKGITAGQSGDGASQRAPGNESTHDRGRAEGLRDSGKNQTVGQGRYDRDDSKQSQEFNKKQGEMSKDRTHQKGDKDQAVSQGRTDRDSDRDNARRSEGSSKEPRDTSKERAQEPGRKDKDQTIGQSKSERDNAQRSEGRMQDKDKVDNKADSHTQQGGSGMQGRSVQDRNSNSGVNQNAAQSQTDTQAQSQAATGMQTQSGKNVTAQQQTTLQESVLHAGNAPRVDANSVNFQVRSGIAVPSSVTVASVSTYPALIDVFPAYRDDSFFIVEDEVVIIDRDRRIIDVVPVGPRSHFAGGDGSSGGGPVAAVDLPPDDIRVIQRVLIDRDLLHGDADGVWGPETREALTVYQRQQGIAATGSIDMRTVSSLGISGRLSQQANQSIQSQSSSTGAQTSTDSTQTTTGQGHSDQTGQRSSQQNATGQPPNQNSDQTQTPTTSSTTRQDQSKSTGQANQPSSRSNQPSANQSASPRSSPSSGSSEK